MAGDRGRLGLPEVSLRPSQLSARPSGMSAFPWTNLITAAASVAGALGAVGLTGLSAGRVRRADLRREAYAAMILAPRSFGPCLASPRDAG
jgi:hypothetical protein